jgi:hypothetical protein
MVGALPWLEYADVTVRNAVAEFMLSSAAEDAVAFKQALANLPPSEAALLEKALRNFAVQHQQSQTSNQQGESKIELKSTFSV